MSWSFTYAGNAKAVAEKVEKEGGTYCPQQIKNFVKEIADRVPEDRTLMVDSNGHFEVRTPPEKQYDPVKSKELGRSVCKDGTDMVSGDHPDSAFIWGSAVFTIKILPTVT